MGLSLTRARETAGLTATDVSRLTRLSPRVVSAIEDERYGDLPAGIYARMAVRDYARAVGIDPAAALAAIQPLLPQAPLDLKTVAELRTPPREPRMLPYALAAAVDAAVLLSIVAAIVIVCAAACQLAPSALLAAAPASMAILCATPIALYFWLLGATDVRTVGPWLLDLEILPPSTGPLSLTPWVRRGGLYVLREASLAATAVGAWRTSDPDASARATP